ncbi:unnamed protein product [Nippostrongylus brasiliensis]|uniref:Uncharacterized protein n=1 Tax=Nippostrongylus brasiliensis TaxID=27835 RepID=A0A158QZS4_NIPBR|nr:unnamed protein product [Nippostrongylus brasiliensis]
MNTFRGDVQALQPYVDAFTQPAHGLKIALEWEVLELDEVGKIEVPIVLSPPLQTALFNLSCRLGDNCVAHLLSRPVRKRVSAQIASLLSDTFGSALKNCDAVQRTFVQLLFDCRVLCTMFSDEKLKSLVQQIESRVDPFDLSILSSYLATNVRLAVNRSQVVDVLPRAEYSQRIPLIPRLDRTSGESFAKRVEVTRMPRNKLLANSNQSGMRNTPSLSSFVDKISSSWFGGN